MEQNSGGFIYLKISFPGYAMPKSKKGYLSDLK